MARMNRRLVSQDVTVSVICTVRDEADHVLTALSSALANGVAEVVVVDDGSTDGTPAVLKALAESDPRIRILTSAPAGRGPALNFAARMAHGDFVVNLDADDALHPEWIQVGMSILRAQPAMAVVAASPYYIAAGEIARWDDDVGQPSVRDVTPYLAFYNPIVHSSAMMRRAAVTAVGGYDSLRTSHFDYDLWIRLARAGWKVGSVDRRLVAKRLHGGQKFEVGNRLAYLYKSAVTQADGIRAVGGGAAAWATLGGRMAWGILPRSVRMSARRMLAGRHRSGPFAVHSAGRGFERAHAAIRHLGSEHGRQPSPGKQ
jgi:glycosyltransferase involved in cell wall biosynthesis